MSRHASRLIPLTSALVTKENYIIKEKKKNRQLANTSFPSMKLWPFFSITDLQEVKKKILRLYPGL